MFKTERVRNAVRGLVQRYGTEGMKRNLWNGEYAGGRWSCLDQMAGDYVYPHVEEHAKGGSVLDLGCGPGAVGNELDPATYESYTGVDISDVAIEKARHKSSANGRSAMHSYVQSDIFTYVPPQRYDVILFGDSIYYVPPQKINAMLTRYSEYLKEAGVFIIRTWLAHTRTRAILRNIESEFHVLERRLYHDSQIAVLTFRPSGRRPASRE